jgi:hypothetical protein
MHTKFEGDPVYSHIDHHGEPTIPFYVYITGVNGKTSPYPSLFPSQSLNPKDADSQSLSSFINLPYDIRLEIYRHCDAPTVFHLMHTTSAIRKETELIFWGHSDPWYYTNATWLISKNGVTGAEHHCPEFASKIQQIEIAVIRL